MYQALYRKWRPKTFDDVVGQSHITETLKKEVLSGRISHAYLFTGSRGTGKTSCAKILAKSVNCISSQDGNPCASCVICESIENENTLDIVEIDAASNNGVENIRSMREEVVFSPTKCKFRVYIVDEVHMLSTGAFNAFLKVLEEPPPHVIFILATTEVHKLPVTIISRCQRFDFHKITSNDIAKRIEYICRAENIQIEKPAVELIAKVSDGGMRDALSILDQCANACENNITEISARKILGMASTDYVLDIAQAIWQQDFSKCLEIIDNMYVESKNMVHLCTELMQYFRNLMVFKLTGKNEQKISLSRDISNLDINNILFALDTLQESYKNMNLGVNKKLEMEIALVKLCSKNGKCEKIEIKQEKVETNLKADDFVQSNDIPTEEVKTASEQPKEISPVLSQESDDSFSHWPKILETLKNEKTLKSLYISLRSSSAYENGNYILIESANSLAFELLRNSEYRTALKKIIRDITGKQYNLGPYNKKTEENFAQENLDPLDKLVQNAKDSGINITLN